jgi:FkbM family methyltransferase
MSTSKLKNNSNPKIACFLSKIVNILPTLKEFHKPYEDLYGLLKEVVNNEVSVLFSEKDNIVEFSPFGIINFPYFKMGNINSLNLFNFDEIIIFSFYYHNRNIYKNLLDIGGNIGLHSIIAGKIGFNVITYEPDEIHFNVLSSNITNNDLNNNVKLVRAAVSNEEGKASFTRVLDNTTGSHLTLSKKNPYGPLEEVVVDKEDILKIIQNNKIDLMKIDAEGHECEILERISSEQWKTCDAIVEVGTPENAEKIFNIFNKTNVNLFSQKRGWNQVTTVSDMPTSHKDGSLFISIKNKMPWGNDR